MPWRRSSFYWLRSARPPRTSFYQPVRVKQAKVQFGGVMGGPGHVAFLKLAFTNPDYLNVFMNANREAITGRAPRRRSGLNATQASN